VVYRGFHLSFEQPIAVKCLKVPGHFTTNAKRLFFERFRQEGKHLAKLDHPAVVRVYDFGVADSPTGAPVPYLVLEWLEGRDLEQVLADRERRGCRALPEAEALALIRPSVDAIALAHEHGIAHRDLKPANLFLAGKTRGTVLKVLDFGIAKAMQEGDTATRRETNTQSGFSAFTPQYGAPEQFSSKKFGQTGSRTDVHALGLILSELCAGRRAMAGEDMTDFVMAALSAKRPTPRRLEADVSDEPEVSGGRTTPVALQRRHASAFRSPAMPSRRASS